jgi:putative membrane protein
MGMRKGVRIRGYSFWTLLLILVLGIIVYISFGVRFDLGVLSRLVIALITIGVLFFAYSKSLEEFFLATITGLSMQVALVNSFGDPYSGTSPIVLHLVFGPWSIFLISLVTTLLVMLWYEKSKYKDKFPLILLSLFVLVWIILGVNVTFYEDWKMENWLTVPFVILLYVLHRWFRLSNLSYGLIFAFMTMHILGSHYTYAEVPFGYWLSEVLGLGRNHYDRIVHFSFGLLMAYPMREVAIRIGNNKGFWGLYVPVEFVLATSCVYELIEWGIAIVFGGDLGIAYLGSQGDVWDAQKDMAAAGLGSIISMTAVFFVRVYYDSKGYLKEFGESFSVKKGALGERFIEILKRR